MKNRFLFFPLFTLIFSIYANELSELNSRAMDDIENYPAESIYHGDMALYNNRNKEFPREYIESGYIISKAYRTIGDQYFTQYYLELAMDQDRKEDYISDSEFYAYAANIFLENKEYDKLNNLVTNEKIISKLDDRGLIEFNIAKLYMDRAKGIEVDNTILENTLSLAASKEYFELEAQLSLFFGELLMDNNRSEARAYFKRAIEISNSDSGIKALIREFELTSRVEHLEKALLRAEDGNNDLLILEVLKLLKSHYTMTRSHQNLAVISEKQFYFSSKRSKFLLKQYEDLSNFSYVEDRLKYELKEREIENSLFKLIIIICSALILLLIITTITLSIKLRRTRR